MKVGRNQRGIGLLSKLNILTKKTNLKLLGKIRNNPWPFSHSSEMKLIFIAQNKNIFPIV